MKRILLAVAILAAAACGQRDSELARTFETGRLALRRGELSEARAFAEHGLALTRSTPDSPQAWSFRLLRGEVSVAQRAFDDAFAISRTPVPAGSEFGALRARQKFLQAKALVGQGHLADALTLLEEVRTQPADPAPAARTLASLPDDVQLDLAWIEAQIRMRLGRRAEAEPALKAVAERAGRAGDHYHQALALNDLGMGNLIRNRWDEAVSWFERVLALTDLELLTVYRAALNNAGICYSRLGQFDRAIAVQEHVVRLQEKRGPVLDYEHALGELGGTHLDYGDIERAVPYLQQALKVSADAGLVGDAALWGRNLAQAYADLRRWDEAERVNEESKRLNPPERAAKLVYNTLIAGQIAAGRGRTADATRLFEEAVAHSETEVGVRWEAYEGLAQVAVTANQPDRAFRNFEAAVGLIEKTRSDLLKTDYRLSYLSRLIRFYQAYVDALIDQGRFDRALEVADSSRARVLAERSGVAAPSGESAASFQRAAARSGAAVLSYWLGPARSLLWVITGSGIHCLMLAPSREIESLVREHRAAITTSVSNPLESENTPGDRLFRLLVEPALHWLPRDGSVVIVPDGALFGLNFETLPVDGARRHYWIEDANVRIAPSLALATRAVTAEPRDDRSVLLIGNPSAPDPQFPPLRYAAIEMRNVAAHFTGRRVVAYDGDRASPVAYRESHPGEFALIHFTAHAAANVQSPLDSAVILSGPLSAYKLYARDVAAESLRAELVTVSACRSAGERAYSGEGLVGFAWAFLRAGAKRVIAGLWDVDDQSTAYLMNDLYERIAAGDPPGDALRSAKLALMRRGGNFAKPYYWGPFELFTITL